MNCASDKTFSIIVPCYNDADVLARCLDSVTRQTYSASQLIVVDDGSTDDTEAVFREFEKNQSHNCIYHHQANAGVSSARNKGINLASSDYLIFLDADDELLPTALEGYRNTLVNSSKPKWLIGNNQWERNGRIKSREIILPKSKTRRFKKYIAKDLHLGNISNMCFARDIFSQLQFPTELRFGEDSVVFALLLTNYDPIIINSTITLAHRRDNSLRTQASLDDLIESKVHSHIFKHPLLGQKYLRFAALHWAQNCRSITRRAYREKEYDRCCDWYIEMISVQPRYAFDIQMMLRYVKARWISKKPQLV